MNRSSAAGAAIGRPGEGFATTAVRLLRCPQWVKNAFVFGGALFGRQLHYPEKLMAVAVTFLAFCAVASAGYIHNDIADREADRAHPLKRLRPIAAGTVSTRTARAVQVLLLALGLGAAASVNRGVLALTAGYLALTMAYSAWLKHLVIVDVMAIAVGFVLRVEAGCRAVAVAPSVWIVLCTFLIATFLGFNKRRAELAVATIDGGESRRVLARYGPKFIDQMVGVVSAITIVCYIMFTVSPQTVAEHGTTNLVYTMPFVLYGIFRYDYLVYQANEYRDPTELVLADRPLLISIGLWVFACVAILYLR